MRLIWGVEPLLMPEIKKTDKTISWIEKSVEICLKHGYIEEDEKLILVGNLLNLPSKTNMISIFSTNELLQTV